MFMKPGRIRNEIYDYTMNTTVEQFWVSKGRPGGVLELVQATVYNASQSSATAVYFLFKHKGIVRRFLYDAVLETVTLRHHHGYLYLDDGDELGIEIDGGAVGDTIEVFMQLLWHKDGGN